jgi:hypothetical protein
VTIETRPLETLDDAKCVGELVYSTYGLTYHRGWLYEPERLIELNRSGALTSMLAIDPSGRSPRVVGHIAAIRPYFEMLAEPQSEPTVLEVGLSIVAPDSRSQSIQNILSMALLMHGMRRFSGLRGAYMKCVTQHTRSQRSARRFLGRAMAVHLGGVPAWVQCDKGDGPSGPLTTIAMHCPLGEQTLRTSYIPAAEASLARELFAAASLQRKVIPVGFQCSDLPSQPTQLTTHFDPARRHGTIRITRPGFDLVDRILDQTDWLVGGSMQHVTVLLPLGSPAVAASVPALQEAGLFLAGFIPDLEGTDTMLLQVLDVPEIDLASIQVEGDETRMLLSEVFARWRATQADPLTGTSFSLELPAASESV